MNRKRSERIRRVSDSAIIGSVAWYIFIVWFETEIAGEKECVCDMKYSESDKKKWLSVLDTSMMSSEESGDEDELHVKPLIW